MAAFDPTNLPASYPPRAFLFALRRRVTDFILEAVGKLADVTHVPANCDRPTRDVGANEAVLKHARFDLDVPDRSCTFVD